MTALALSLQARIVDRQAEALSHDVATTIRSRVQVVRGAAETLQAALDAAHALGADGLPPVAVPDRQREAAKRCATNLRRLAGRLEGAEGDEAVIGSVLQGSSAIDEGRRVALEVTRLSRGSLQRAMEAERAGLVPGDIDATVPDIPGKAALKVRLTRLRHELTTEVRVGEEDLGDIEGLRGRRARLTVAVEEWRAAVADLAEALEGFDPEMRDFLLRTSEPEGASLALLTDDLRAKLLAAGTLDQFRIHRRGGDG